MLGVAAPRLRVAVHLSSAGSLGGSERRTEIRGKSLSWSAEIDAAAVSQSTCVLDRGQFRDDLDWMHPILKTFRPFLEPAAKKYSLRSRVGSQAGQTLRTTYSDVLGYVCAQHFILIVSKDQKLCRYCLQTAERITVEASLCPRRARSRALMLIEAKTAPVLFHSDPIDD